MHLPAKSLRIALAFSLVSLALPAAADTRLEIQGGVSYMDSSAADTVFVEGIFDEHRIGNSRM